MEQRLPYLPEPLAILRARYADAVNITYDFDEIDYDHPGRPGSQRRHVFDTEEGIRLIISRDKEDGETFIHFSASVEPGYPAWHMIRASTLTVMTFKALAVKWFRAISGDHRKVRSIGLSPGKKVPHFHIVEEVVH